MTTLKPSIGFVARAELRPLAEAVSILSMRSFSFTGRPVTVSLGEATNPRSALIASLQAKLYEQGFCRRFSGVVRDEVVSGVDQSDDLTGKLSRANGGKPRWSKGWALSSLEPNGRATATKNGASVLLSAGEYVVEDGRGAPLRIGASVNFYLPTQSLTLQPGFYFAFGESMEDHRDQMGCVRFYWSIVPSGGADLLKALTERLNRFRVPFHCKCQRSRAQYQRLDPIVLYLDKRFYQVGVHLIGEAYTRVRDHMKPASPILTKVLAPGLALAEDPPHGESFGMHRCRIVAEELCDAYDRGIADTDTRLDLIEAGFARRGLSFQQPYLNPGSIDRYNFTELPERSGK